MIKEHQQSNSCQLLRFPLFLGCNEDTIQKIEKIQYCSHFTRNDYIFKEGQEANSVFCLCWGKVKIVKKKEDHTLQIISLTRPGDILGLRAVISEDIYPHSAIALEDCAGYYIERKDLLYLIKNFQPIFINSSRLLCKEIDALESKIANLIQYSVSQRVAITLLILKETYGVDNQQCINVDISKGDIANMANTTRVTIYRVLNHFKRNGIIDIKDKRIRILNVQRLEQLANE